MMTLLMTACYDDDKVSLKMWLNKKYLPEVLGDTFDVPEDGSDEKVVAFQYISQ